MLIKEVSVSISCFEIGAIVDWIKSLRTDVETSSRSKKFEILQGKHQIKNSYLFFFSEVRFRRKTLLVSLDLPKGKWRNLP